MAVKRTVYILKDRLPPVCARCEERRRCMADGFGEACCDECDDLLGRFEVIKLDSEGTVPPQRQEK